MGLFEKGLFDVGAGLFDKLLSSCSRLAHRHAVLLLLALEGDALNLRVVALA